ncbi:winged helix-turn-helix transcriptional regulator [Methanococcus maripaludis]|uniref:Regulatory protein MarR n=2 Tax=Methanococcus maripaludis TaxID=39152 RepID=A6VJ37_METM7|nr:winged helix-turn-helix transcriptional regulator [Methanococcus maripaludis]MBA2862264.1 putative membrane protein [Methanococcus maripaludis]
MSKPISTNYRIYLIIALIFCSISTVDSYRFDEYSVQYTIDQNDNFYEIIDLKIYNNNSDDLYDISYSIPQETSDLTFNSSKGIDSYSITTNDAGVTEVNVKLDEPIGAWQSGDLSISFNGQVSDLSGKKQVYIIVPAYDSNFKVSVQLPEGAAIVSPVKDVLSINPRDYTVGTNGKSIFVEWEKELTSDEKYFEVTINYVMTAITPVITEDNNENLYRAISIVLGVLVVALIFFIYRNYNKVKMINELQNEIIGLNKGLEISQLNLQNKNKEIRRLEELNDHVLKELDLSKNTLTEYESKISELKEKIMEFKAQLENFAKLKEEVISKDSEIKNLSSYKKLSEELKIKITELNEILEEKEDYILELMGRIGDYESHKSETLMNILTDDEKGLIELIREHGSISQKEIVDITGLTKPKVSRMISDLEQRGMVRKVKIGRINKIAISEDLDGSI